MKKLTALLREYLRWGLTIATWGSYAVLSIIAHDWVGAVITALSVLPVIVTSWYFGLVGSALAVIAALTVNAFILISVYEYSLASAFLAQIVVLGDLLLMIVAFVVGFLSRQNQRLNKEILEREKLEKERQEYTDFLVLLNNITRAALESDDLPAMLQNLANRMGALFGTDNSFITLWDDERQLTTPAAAFGPQSSSFLRVQFEPGENTITAKVLQSRQALSVFDVRTSQDVHPQKAPAVYQGSMLALPLIAGERKLGAVILAHNSLHHFTENEISRGEMAARHISLALSKGFSLGDAERKNKELAAIFQLSTELAVQLDEKTICQKVVDCVHQKLGYYYLGFYLVDEDSGDRVLQSSAGWPDMQEIARIPPGKGITELPILDGLLHYTPDVKEEPLYVAAVGSGSEVDVPIWIGESVGGVLAAEKKEPHAFDQSDFDTLAAVANLTGLALTRSRLFSAERKQFDELAILHAVALAITEATNEDKLIERATLIIGESLYPDNFGILLMDENIGALRVHPSYSFHKKLGEELTVPLGKGVIGRVAETGISERIANVSLSSHYWDVDSKTRAELAVPMKLGEHVIGVINAESKLPGAFSDADERLLTTLAGQLATAIDSLRASEAERKWAAQLARSNALIGALGQVAARIESASNLDSVLETLGQELKKLELACLVALRGSDKDELSIRYTSFEPHVIRIFERASGFKMGEFCIPIEKLSSHFVLTQHSRPIILTDPVGAGAELLGGYPKQVVARVLEKVDFTRNSSVGHFPLLHEESILGLLWLWGENLREEDLPAMSIFANQVAVAIENARLFSEVQRLAFIDELTGLHNRRHFYSIAQIEFSRGRRYRRALAAMMLDIDHFKKFNDTYGHAIGDQVLQAVAKLCKQSLRETDILGRYGGEEFVILLPETNLEVARTVAERLRKGIDEALISTQKGDLSVTVSIGVAENSELTPTLETLIARADQAMYIAKHKGRNQVAASI